MQVRVNCGKSICMVQVRYLPKPCIGGFKPGNPAVCGGFDGDAFFAEGLVIKTGVEMVCPQLSESPAKIGLNIKWMCELGPSNFRNQQQQRTNQQREKV